MKVEPKEEFRYESFGDTLNFAESLGWDDCEDDRFPDEIEQSALEFIESKGYKVLGGER